ncbi:DotU family type IV/VI secretion system protein, partial [Campylobacter lari]
MQKESHFKEGSLLLESDLKGLEINKVVDNCLEILLLVYRLSKVHSLGATYIENLKEKLVNEILVWSSRLSTFKEYD